jgi:hypothetical protein
VWDPLTGRGNPDVSWMVKEYLKDIHSKLEVGALQQQSLRLFNLHVQKMHFYSEPHWSKQFGISEKTFSCIFKLVWYLFFRAEEICKYFKYGDYACTTLLESTKYLQSKHANITGLSPLFHRTSLDGILDLDERLTYSPLRS